MVMEANIRSVLESVGAERIRFATDERNDMGFRPALAVEFYAEGVVHRYGAVGSKSDWNFDGAWAHLAKRVDEFAKGRKVNQ
jgi:hypothetical protein